jgi:hypothetical protein
MKLQLTEAERNLAVLWVVATTVGWGIGFFVCELLTGFLALFAHLGGDGLVIGAGIGIAQGIVLRRRISFRFSFMGWWWLVSSLGFGAGKVLGEAAAQAIPAAVGHLLTGAIIGAAVGAAQWLLLFGNVRAAAWWVVASIVGWAVGWSLISLAEDAAGLSTLMVYVVGGIGAALAGIVTGANLIWQSRPRPA